MINSKSNTLDTAKEIKKRENNVIKRYERQNEEFNIHTLLPSFFRGEVGVTMWSKIEDI